MHTTIWILTGIAVIQSVGLVALLRHHTRHKAQWLTDLLKLARAANSKAVENRELRRTVARLHAFEAARRTSLRDARTTARYLKAATAVMEEAAAAGIAADRHALLGRGL